MTSGHGSVGYRPTRRWTLPTNNFCMDWAATRSTRVKGIPFMGANTPYEAGPGGHLGALIAWDPSAAKKVWEVQEPFPSWSGVLATAGDVVFYGTLDGWFKSVDATNGNGESTSGTIATFLRLARTVEIKMSQGLTRR